MNLVNTELSTSNKYSSNQIFITSFNGENNILMECENSDEAKEWIEAVKIHISYANQETEHNIRKSRKLTDLAFNNNNSSASNASNVASDVSNSNASNDAGVDNNKVDRDSIDRYEIYSFLLSNSSQFHYYLLIEIL